MHSLEAIQEEIIPILKENGVKRASLFGSTVRDTREKDSDLDVLVELEEGSSLFDLIRLKNELEKKLGMDVDLVTYNSLNPLLEEKILREKQDIL